MVKMKKTNKKILHIWKITCPAKNTHHDGRTSEFLLSLFHQPIEAFLLYFFFT